VSLDPARARSWFALGIGPLWVERSAAQRDAQAQSVPSVPAGARLPPRCATPESLAAPARGAAPADARTDEIRRLDWDTLRTSVAACTACSLCKSRRQTVFGVGYPHAHWMFVGEAPGAEEDQRGEPFVGQAGRLLDNMLAALGLSRAAQDEHGVYIANVLKCRPPGNRNPEPAEVTLCEPYLLRQVELVRPRVIVVMGRFAAQSLLRTDATIASLRGRAHTFDLAGTPVPLVVTYHPAYLLRNLADKAKAWADLCLARDVYERASGGA
jgi:DNA polymerase